MTIHRSLLLLLCWALLAQAASGQIIVNGDFSNGLAGWGLSQQEGARAEMSTAESGAQTADQAARIRIVVPKEPQRLQFSQKFEASKLQAGKVYELVFRARAEEPTSFLAIVIKAAAPYGSLGLRAQVNAGPEWQSFRFPFRAAANDQPYGRLVFMLGQSKGTVWLDDAQIRPHERVPLQGGGPVLEDAAWRLEFAPSGAVYKLTYKPTGQALLEGDGETPVYRVTLQDKGAVLYATNAEGKAAAAKADDQRVEFSYDHPGFRVVLTAAKESGGVEFRSRVENQGQAAITGIAYPILSSPMQLGDTADDDAILFPLFDGGLIENPPLAMAKEPSLEGDYPGPLSCQVAAHYDGQQGLVFTTLDNTGSPKRFRVEAADALTWTFEHLFPAEPGGNAAVDYPTRLTPYAGGSWEAGAEIYRRWSHRQWWCAKTLAERSDFPKWMRGGGLVAQYQVNARDQKGNLTNLTPRMRGVFDSAMKAYGVPLIANIRSWEAHGAWCGQEYLPPFPSEEEFRSQARALRDAGGRGMIMLSGYRWTLEKKLGQGKVYTSDERYEREVKPWVVYGQDGKPLLRTGRKEGDFHGDRWVQMCRVTEYAKKTIVDVARYCVQAGWPVIHFDQEVSGNYAASVCYSDKHGHPAGHGRWVHEAMADLYKRIRETCAPLDPDFALSMEEPNELYLQQLNLCQERPFGITTEWPGKRPETRTVPLFMYLYHDYLVGWAAFYPWKSGGHLEEVVAKGFAAGQMPGLTPITPVDAQTNPALAATMDNCMKAYRTYALDFLLFGRMLEPLRIGAPERKLKLGQYGETAVPAVWHSVWRAPDGRIGVVLANSQDKEQSLALDLAPLLSVTASAKTVYKTLAGEALLAGPKVEVKIPAHSLTLVEITPAGA